MSVAAFALSATVLALPVSAAAADATRAPVRCAPAPYYVADRHHEPAGAERSDADKRTPRPCYLVRSDGRSDPSSKRIA